MSTLEDLVQSLRDCMVTLQEAADHRSRLKDEVDEATRRHAAARACAWAAEAALLQYVKGEAHGAEPDAVQPFEITYGMGKV